MAIPGLNIDPVALTNGTTMFITAIVLLMVIAIGGLASYAYMQFRAHNVTVEILVGDGQVGTMRRKFDRGRLFINTDTYQTSFHLFWRRIYVPNVSVKHDIIDGKIELEQIGNLEFVPIRYNFTRGDAGSNREMDLEFTADGVKRNQERKIGKPSLLEKYQGLVMMGITMLASVIIVLIMFRSTGSIAQGLQAAAEMCKSYTVSTPPAQGGALS